MSTPPPLASVRSLGEHAGEVAASHIDHAFRAILTGDEVSIDAHSVRLMTNTPHPFGNFALLRDGSSLSAAEAAVEPLIPLTMPTAVLSITPFTPAVFGRLNLLGFQSAGPMPAMVVEIDALSATSLPSGYTLGRVGSGPESDAWANAFTDGYELPRRIGDFFAPNIVHATTALDEPLQFFAVRKNGRIVCTSLLYLANGVAGLYCVATIPEERKRGLAAHITAEPLRMARQLGYRVGVLQSSHAGHNVYKRLGFKDVGEVPLFVRMPG